MAELQQLADGLVRLPGRGRGGKQRECARGRLQRLGLCLHVRAPLPEHLLLPALARRLTQGEVEAALPYGAPPPLQRDDLREHVGEAAEQPTQEPPLTQPVLERDQLGQPPLLQRRGRGRGVVVLTQL